MHRFPVVFPLFLFLLACQSPPIELGTSSAGLSSASKRRQPIIMLDAHGWRYQRGMVVQEEPGNVYLSLPSLEHGELLQSVTVFWAAGAGHQSEVSRPVLWVFQQDELGDEQHLAKKPDAAGTLADYEETHPITADVGGARVDLESYHYYVRLTSEEGAGFMPGGWITALAVQTRCEQDFGECSREDDPGHQLCPVAIPFRCGCLVDIPAHCSGSEAHEGIACCMPLI
jgi:hypothetical protein